MIMKHRRDAGFSLAALIFFATALSILMAAAVPAYQMQAKRALEEELHRVKDRLAPGHGTSLFIPMAGSLTLSTRWARP